MPPFRRIAALAVAAVTACTPGQPRSPGDSPPPGPVFATPVSTPALPGPAPPPPSASAEPAPAPPPPEEPRYDPSLPTNVPVEGDLPVLVAHGPMGQSRAIVYLHGVCGDVTKYRAWSEAAVRFGTVVALRGDDKCDDPGRFKWGHSPARTDRRIVAALRAVGAVRGGAGLDTESVTLVGYSQGSLRAEQLARAVPSRYRRAVLIAGPKDHAPDSFAKALAIAIVAGEKDLKTHLQDSAAKATKAGVRARYFELPGARHGDYGTDAVRVMGDILSWVLDGRQDG